MSQEHLDRGKRQQQHGKHCDGGYQAQQGHYENEEPKGSFSEPADKPRQAHPIRWRVIKQPHESHRRGNTG